MYLKDLLDPCSTGNFKALSNWKEDDLYLTDAGHIAQQTFWENTQILWPQNCTQLRIITKFIKKKKKKCSCTFFFMYSENFRVFLKASLTSPSFSSLLLISSDDYMCLRKTLTTSITSNSLMATGYSEEIKALKRILLSNCAPRY